MHDVLDYSLSAAVVGFIAKHGYTFLREWRNGKNGSASPHDLREVIHQARETGVTQVKEVILTANQPIVECLGRIESLNGDMKDKLIEIAATLRERRP